MSKVPIRIRLAAASSAGLLVVLALVAAFVYARVGNELTRALDASLKTRADDVRTLTHSATRGEIDLGGVRSGEGESTFTQLVDPDGHIVDSTVPAGAPLLDPGELARARSETIHLDGLEVPGVEGLSRAIALPVDSGGRTLIAIVGASTDDREEAQSGIVRAFALGAPFAVLLAAAIGYLLGTRAMMPVEAMRSRARDISLDRAGERLPAPMANDELRRLAETLNAMLDRIEEVLERERVFVSDASHELRSPLTILKAEIEVIRKTGGTKEELEAALDSVAEEVDLLVRLAEDLLIVARADRGQLPIRRESIEVAELFGRIAARHSPAASREGRRLVVDDGGIGVVRVDPPRLEQALTNLVDNAIRHGAGTVSLRAARSDSGGLLFSVTDEGAGFSPAFEARAFERFAQASASRGDSSAGLGLAIVRAIAQAHGGDASIIARDRPGATVAITIPP